MAYVQYDWQDQNHNWSGTSQAPSQNNGDQEIKTDFIMIGAQYMFNRSWGAQIELPYAYRTFTTIGGPTGTAPTTANARRSAWMVGSSAKDAATTSRKARA